MSRRVSFLARDFSAQRAFPRVQVEVLRYSWRALGGPHQAELRASGAEEALAELAEELRSPLVIWNELGMPVWAGFLASTRLVKGLLSLENGLEALANRVRAWYRPPSTDSEWTGRRTATPWADDLESQALLGVKEAQLVLDEASPEQAAQARDAYLQARRMPGRVLSRLANKPTGACELRLSALGWWHSLAWRCYEQPAGLEGDTAPASGWMLVGTPDTQILRQTFTARAGVEPWIAHRVSLRLHLHGAPTDNLLVELRSSPGALIASGSLTAGALSSAAGWVDIPLSPAPLISPGVAYEVRILRTGTLDPANAYRADLDRAGMRSDGQLAAWDGAAWQPVESGGSLLFKLEGLEDTLAQVRRMLASAAGGQFLSGISAQDSSGLQVPLWREGARPAQEEVEALLKLGSAAGRRYLASVGADRVARIWEAPQPGEADYTLKPDGALFDAYEVRVPPGVCPAGVWVRGENLPESHSGSPRAFVEECEWDEGKGRLILMP